MFIVIGGRKRKFLAKSRMFQGKSSSWGGRKRSLKPITSLVLPGNSRGLAKVTSPGEVRTTVRLGIKSWFADVDLAQVTPFGVCCLFFNKRKAFPGIKTTTDTSPHTLERSNCLYSVTRTLLFKL